MVLLLALFLPSNFLRLRLRFSARNVLLVPIFLFHTESLLLMRNEESKLSTDLEYTLSPDRTSFPADLLILELETIE